MKFCTLILITMLLGACTPRNEGRVEQDDRHEHFKDRLQELATQSIEGHGPCREWVEQVVLASYQETQENSPDQMRGIYHRLVDPSETAVQTLLESFPIDQLHRLTESTLYELPLNYPTSDRNLRLFLDVTHPLPQCETSFHEYGLLDALLNEMKLQSWPDSLKRQVQNFLFRYLEVTLHHEALSFGNLLTNLALMRSMAEYDYFPQESVYPLSGLLNDAERFHQRSMESFRTVAVSEDRPTLSEFRAILVLHRERREKTLEIAQKLQGLLAFQVAQERGQTEQQEI